MKLFSYPLFPLLFSSCKLLSGRVHSLIQVRELGARLWEAVRISGARERHSRSLLLRSLAVQPAKGLKRDAPSSGMSACWLRPGIWALGEGKAGRGAVRQRRFI